MPSSESDPTRPAGPSPPLEPGRSSSWSMLPDIPSRELPKADIGIFRHSRKARDTVDGAIKGAYGLGVADGGSYGYGAGYAVGHAAGYVEGTAAGVNHGFAAGQVAGHATGYFEASVTCSAVYGVLTFMVLVVVLLMKASKR
jgi:hypothetical protein